MITGVVTAHREAVVRVDLLGATGLRLPVEAVVDTGFTGDLTLPLASIQRMTFSFAGSRRAALADGAIVALDAYKGAVLWDGRERPVVVLATEGGPAIGMSLLYSCRLAIDVVASGPVRIEPLVT